MKEYFDGVLVKSDDHPALLRKSVYRADIDGLRALAVLPVVLFHLDVGLFSGGFVGVDVFFVISGYLITKILVDEVSENRYSILKFYDRRIRRIFPALFAVMTFSIFAAMVLMYPPELVDFSKSLLYSISFLSNIYFYMNTEYFGILTRNGLLIHTWSLAVEEQFYIVFPILLFLLRKKSKMVQAAFIVGLSVLSFAGAEYLVVFHRTDAAFYLAPARSWELMIGSLLAFYILPGLRKIWIRESLAALGIVLIVASCLRFHAYMLFPGAAAAIPCLGAASIIYAGQYGTTQAGRLLSSRPFVYTGMISYSLYLWHWPIIVCARLYWIGPFTALKQAELFAVSFIVAIASLRWIEMPFRQRHVLASSFVLRTSALTVMAAFVGVGVLLIVSAQSLPWFTPAENQLADYIQYHDRDVYRRGLCFIDPHSASDRHYDETACASVDPNRKNILLLGDSHAAHLWKGFSIIRPEINFLQATASGCKPVLGGRGEADCVTLIDHMLIDKLSSERLDGIILSARWIESDIPALLATVDALRSKVGTIYVSGPIIEYSQSLPRVLLEVERRDDLGLIARARSQDIAPLDAMLQSALASRQVVYLSPYQVLCRSSGSQCVTQDDQGIPIQWDYGHLTEAGSIYVAARLFGGRAD